MDASGNNSPDLVVTTQGTGPGELVYLAAGQQIAVSGISISGISISAGPQTTTQASTGITGAFVWLAGSQTMSVQVSGIVPTTTAAGASGVTGLPVWVGNPGSGGGASATATSQSAMSTGVGVWLAPTQTVTVAISGVTPTTTASGLSGITGVPVWVGGGALSGGGATATATSQSAMSTALGVWMAPTQTLALLSTVVTVLGTVLVSEAGPVSISGVAATTTASGLSGITGLPVWVANPGSGSGATASATSQSAMSTALGVWLAPTQTLSLVSTIVTILGTQIVSVVPGLSVSAVVPSITAVSTVVTLLGTVAVSQVAAVSLSGAGATATQSSLTTGVPVIFVQTQTLGAVNTIITVLGTQIVSVVPGLSVSAVVPSITAVSTVVTLLGTVAVSQVAAISISGVTPTTTASGLSGSTGLPVWVANFQAGSGATASATSQSAMSTALGVWLAPTQTVALVSTIVTVLGTQIVSVVPGLPVQISGIVPTTTASGLSGITGLPVWLVGGAGGGTTLISVVSTIVTILGFSVVTTSSQAATASGLVVWVGNPAGAGATVNLSSITPTTTQASGVTGLPVWLMASQTMAVSATISGSVNISGVVAVTDAVAGYVTTSSQAATTTGLVVWVGNPGGAGSGATATATSQSAMSTALGVWLAPTQTISLVSTIVTILGTQVVTVVPGLSVSAVVPSITAVSTVVTLLGTVAVSQMAAVSLSGAGATVTQSSLTTGIPVIFVQTQTIGAVNTIITILGTQVVTVVPGLSVSAVVPSITAVSTIVTILGTQIVSVVPGLPVQISGITPTTTASGLSGITGLPVWQVGGGSGATATATSQSAMSTALGVWLAPTQTVSLVSTIVTVLGTQIVSVVPGLSVSAVVPSITAVSTVVTLLGTVAVSQVAAVSLSGAGATVTQSSLTTGIPVIFVQTQTLGIVNTILTIVTQLGTQIVSVVPGVSVTAAVVGTISLLTVAGTTTASGLSGITGLPVWVANPGSGGGATASATSQSAMSTALGVWLAPTQTLSLVSTVVTLLGTVAVSQVAAISISSVAATTTASGLSGITGLPVWIGNTVSVSVSVSVSLSGSLQISGITPTTTASGLSGITGLPVWVGGGALSGGGATATATSQSAMSTALGVWLAQTQTIFLVSTIVTLLGTVAITGTIVNSGATTTQSSLTTGLAVWLAPTQTMAVVSTVATILGTLLVSQVPGAAVVISGVTPTTTASGLSGSTGLPVWVGNTVSVTITQAANTPFIIAGTVIYAAAASSSAGPIPFTINVGSTAATVTSAWSIPAANFRLNAVYLMATGAGATTPTIGYFQVAYSSAGTTGTVTTPTILGTKPQLLKIPVGAGAAAASFGIIGAQLDIGSSLTQTIMLWLNYPGTTGTSVTILFNLIGYLF